MNTYLKIDTQVFISIDISKLNLLVKTRKSTVNEFTFITRTVFHGYRTDHIRLYHNNHVTSGNSSATVLYL